MKISTQSGLVPHFSGHETFPLRQMWLKKAFDQANMDRTVSKSTFSDDDAIAKFGVGKNMVAAIKHWALACDVLRDNLPSAYSVSPTASMIFADDGLDPYSENPSTAWYAHWWLAGRGSRATTWYWLFNHVTTPSFSRDELEAPLMEFASRLDSKRKLSASTLSRDLETCLRSYAPRAAGASPEDFAYSMVVEMCFIIYEQ